MKEQKLEIPPLASLKNAGNLALILKTLTIITAVLAFYYQDLAIVFNDALQDEATSCVLVVPILFLYLLYRKRKMLRSAISREEIDSLKQGGYLASLCGVLLSATAMILYWYGSYTFTPLEYHVLTVPLFAAGLVLISFNPQTLRQAAFPIAFLAFLTPPPSDTLYGLGSSLSVLGSEAANTIVNTLRIRSTISSEYGNPTIILTRPNLETMGFTIDIACSGIYSLIGFLIFAAFMAYITRDKTWKKATIFVIGFPLIYLLNIIRITTILLIGYQYGEELALQVFHLLGGWILIFLGTLILLVITEKLFKTRIFGKPQTQTLCQNCGTMPANPTENFCARCGRLLRYPKITLKKQDIAKIAAIAISVLILVSVQTPVFALTKGPAQVIIQTPTGEEGNSQILPKMPERTLQFIFRDKDFEQEAKQDASLVFEYKSQNESEESVYVGVEVAQTMTSLHRWETCLITWPQTHGYQPKVAQLDLRDVQLLQNPPLIARYFAFKYTQYNQTQIVLYWFETALFTMNDTVQQKRVEISLVIYSTRFENITEAEDNLLQFAIAIANYWQPMKTWAQVTLFISKNGDKLALATTTMLLAAIIIQTIEKRSVKNRNFIAYHKLSTGDIRIIDAIQKTEKNTKPTLQNIASTYEGTTHEKINHETLYEKLIQTEKIGLISSETISQQDEPVQAWKANLRKPSQAKGTLSNLLHRSFSLPPLNAKQE